MKQVIIDINGVPYEFDSIIDSRPITIRETVAQKITIQHSSLIERHKVLVSPEGQLFNSCDPGTKLTKKSRRFGMDVYYYNLRNCSEDCYRDYVAFLRSKNKTNLILAQRRFYDES